MSGPPKDRWIVVWTRGTDFDDRPVLVKWEEGLVASAFGTGFADSYYGEAPVYEHEISAWAECPACPHQDAP